MDKQYYTYQCASCYRTLYSDDLPDGEDYISVVDGSVCPDCISEQDDSNDYDDDDD